MSLKRTGLGRNLSALLQQVDVSTQHTDLTPKNAPQRLIMLPIEALKPGVYQPRGVMDEEALQALAASIEQQGMLQPIVVRRLENSEQYEIIAGERRWRASQMASMTDVPVIVRDVNDETAMAFALIENLQREALNVMDEARAMHRLQDEFGLTHQEIAHLLSKSRAAVSNCLRLLQLLPQVAVLLEEGKIDMGHARCLINLEPSEQERIANLVVSRGLSVRETEAWVARLKAALLEEKPAKIGAAALVFDKELKQVSAYLGATVQLKTGKSGQGRLMIDFKDAKQLKKLLEKLGQKDSETVS